MTTPDAPLVLRPAPDALDKRLQYIVQQLIDSSAADAVVILSRHNQNEQFTIVAMHGADVVSPTAWHSTIMWLIERLNRVRPDPVHPSSQPQMYPLDSSLEFFNALFWPLVIPAETIGCITFFSRTRSYFHPEHIAQIETLAELVRSVLENDHLAERLIATEAIAKTAQAIARNPSPQQIVHILRDYLFDSHVASCAIALYGPSRADNPTRPFEYVEVMADWSRSLGSRIVSGSRFYFEGYTGVIGLLESTDSYIIFSNDALEEFVKGLEEFPRKIIEMSSLKSIALIPLRADHFNVGILAIATDQAHEFNEHELRSYQLVGEFLTMTTMADELRRQHDFVQQGRAALLDAVTDAVIMVMPDPEATVLTVNKQFMQMFSVKEKEAHGLPLLKLLDKMRLPVNARQELLSQWQQINDGATVQLQGEFHTTGSAQTDIEWYTAPVFLDDRVLGRIYTFHDVTPERMAERLRYELLSRISHELRTPLTSISGFAQFILEQEGDKLPDLARQYTEIILKSARHLNQLFTDMIQIAQANAGALKLHMSQASLSDVIIESIARLEFQYKSRNQKVVMTLDDNLPIVYIDIDRVDQVLTNIIYNAVKYGPEAGQIRVVTSFADQSADLPRSAPPETITPCILVSVVDQGAGLSDTEIDKVFLPFYRTRAARAGQIEGTGLGLAVSRSIIELHGGRIWAEAATKRKAGGRFFFTLLASDQRPPERETPSIN